MSKEKDWCWTDELVAEFGEFYFKTQGGCEVQTWGKNLLELFKEKKLKELKEKVDEYMNQPILSMNDLLNLSYDTTTSVIRINKNDLVELIKKKING